jgi:hypothetical protein
MSLISTHMCCITLCHYFWPQVATSELRACTVIFFSHLQTLAKTLAKRKNLAVSLVLCCLQQHMMVSAW